MSGPQSAQGSAGSGQATAIERGPQVGRGPLAIEPPPLGEYLRFLAPLVKWEVMRPESASGA